MYGKLIALLYLFIASFSCVAQTASFPSKPINIVVPTPPGGTADILARLVARQFEVQFNSPAIVTNISGGSGMIATQNVVRAAADGHTLLVGHPGILTVNPVLQPKVSYDPEKDLMPLAILTRASYVLCVHPGVKAANLMEFIALAKSVPGKLNYGTSGLGTTSHLTMELFKREAGLDIVHVPFNGAAPATQNLIAGVLTASFENLATLVPRLKSGQLRALAVASSARVPLLPDVPTIAEAGLKSWGGVSSWLGLVLPAGTPKEPFEKLAQNLATNMHNEDFQKRLMQAGFEPSWADAAAFRALIREELGKWGRLVKETNLKPE